MQDTTFEYHNIVDSKYWEPVYGEEKSQYQPYLPDTYTVVIYQSVNKALNKVGFNYLHSVNGNGYGGLSSVR